MTAEAEAPVTGAGSRAGPGQGAGRAEHLKTSVAGTKAEPALLEAVLDRSNMRRAYDRVVRNKGAAGVDGLGVSELGDLLRQHWPTIKAKLLDGIYRPQPVRQVSIPKPNGGERKLGIPPVLDRLSEAAPASEVLYLRLFRDGFLGLFRRARCWILRIVWVLPARHGVMAS